MKIIIPPWPGGLLLQLHTSITKNVPSNSKSRWMFLGRQIWQKRKFNEALVLADFSGYVKTPVNCMGDIRFVNSEAFARAIPFNSIAPKKHKSPVTNHTLSLSVRSRTVVQSARSDQNPPGRRRINEERPSKSLCRTHDPY